MEIGDALEDVRIAFLQLEFAIKLLSFSELGHIEPAAFDTDHLVKLPEGNIRFPAGHFSDGDNIIRAASVSVLLAFSASALVLDNAFEVAGRRPDPDAEDDAGRLRTLIYMVRCAQAHGLSDPRWEAKGRYLRKFTVAAENAAIELDLANLNGAPFRVEQLGGYVNWYRMRDAAVKLLGG